MSAPSSSTPAPPSGGGSGSVAKADVIKKVIVWGVMFIVLLGITFGVAIHLSPPTNWIVALTTLILTVVIGFAATRSRTTATTSAPSNRGGDNTTAFAVAAMLMVAGFAFVFMEFTHVKLLNEQGAQRRDAERLGIREVPVVAYPYSAGVSTDIPITGGDASIVVPEHPIMMGYNNEPPFEYGGEPRVFPTRSGSYILRLWAKGTFPVKVKVYVKPNA